MMGVSNCLEEYGCDVWMTIHSTPTFTLFHPFLHFLPLECRKASFMWRPCRWRWVSVAPSQRCNGLMDLFPLWDLSRGRICTQSISRHSGKTNPACDVSLFLFCKIFIKQNCRKQDSFSIILLIIIIFYTTDRISTSSASLPCTRC